MSQIRDPQTHGIIGAAMEVHRLLGPGFLEGVYHEALAIELAERGIPFVQKPELTVVYKGQNLKCTYIPDFICFGSVILEIKALSALTNIEVAQALNYLKATGLERALLVNFGTPSLQFQRLVRSHLQAAIEPASN